TKQQYAELIEWRQLLESIQAKSNLAYVAWKRDKLATAPQPVRAAPPAGLRLDFPWPQPKPDVLPPDPSGQPLLRLDADFFTQLDTLLTAPERALYQRINVGVPRPDTHADHDAGLKPERWTSLANRLCHQISLWEDQEQTQLPETPQKPPG